MNRRTTRERREYIYRKSKEAQEHQIYERKQAIKAALASGKSLPTELRNEARELGGTKELLLDESQREPGSHIDDEYAKVGLYDPKIVITTSRDPSSRLLQFSKVGLSIHLIFRLTQLSRVAFFFFGSTWTKSPLS